MFCTYLEGLGVVLKRCKYFFHNLSILKLQLWKIQLFWQKLFFQNMAVGVNSPFKIITILIPSKLRLINPQGKFKSIKIKS